MFCYIYRIFIFIFMLCFGGHAHAWNLEALQDRVPSPEQIGWYLDVSDYKYREYMNGQQLMSLDGHFIGLKADYALQMTPLVQWRSETRLLSAVLDYRGYIQKVENNQVVLEPYSTSGFKDWLWELKTVGQFDYHVPAFAGRFWVSPYLGMAYRYLRDDSTHVETGYHRASNYYYIPVGFELDFGLFTIPAFSSLMHEKNLWHMGFSYEWDYFLSGTQVSDLGEYVLKKKQHQGSGFRLSLLLEHHFPSFGTVMIEPYAENWFIDDSETVCATNAGGSEFCGFEPENTTQQAGFRLVLKY